MNEPTQQIQKNDHDRELVAHRQVTSFSGPLPHPKILEHYDKIIPGAAERILKMTENQSDHRKELEKAVIMSDVKNSKLGLCFGLIIGLAGLAAAVLIAIYSNPYLSGFIGFTTLASLVSTFVYGAQQRKQERKEAKKDRSNLLDKK